LTDPITASAALRAEAVAPDLLKAGARWTGRQIPGTPVECGMRSVYERAIASLLVEVGGADEDTGAAPRPAKLRPPSLLPDGTYLRCPNGGGPRGRSLLARRKREGTLGTESDRRDQRCHRVGSPAPRLALNVRKFRFGTVTPGRDLPLAEASVRLAP